MLRCNREGVRILAVHGRGAFVQESSFAVSSRLVLSKVIYCVDEHTQEGDFHSHMGSLGIFPSSQIVYYFY